MKKTILLISLLQANVMIAEDYLYKIDNNSYKDYINIEDNNSDSNNNNGNSGNSGNTSPYTEGMLVETDYKILGDKLSTLDTRTGIEWLDLNETRGMSYNQVSSLLSTSLSGWRFPTPQEIYTLYDAHYSSSSIDSAIMASTSADSYAGLLSNEDVGEIFQKFGITNDNTSMSTHRFSGAFYLIGNTLNYTASRYSFDLASTTFQINQTSPSFNRDFSHPSVGFFLVSEGGTTLSSINNPNINIPYN